jgi:hypothetical protein
VRVELAFIPSQFREEMLNFTVSIGGQCMLNDLLRANRDNLISRCSLKVSQRFSPAVTASELQYGVPLIIDQLSEALAREEASPTSQEDAVFGYSTDTPGSIEAARTAALHGIELFRLGYTVDQVVHDYGDLCQAITELAKEMDAPVTVDEFHTFNRLLDSSIASAVSAFVRHQHSSHDDEGAKALHDQIGMLADEQRMLVHTALKALAALKVGNIGLMGATGTVLEDSLLKLRDIIDRSLPEIRTASGMLTPRDPAPANAKRPGEQTAGSAWRSLASFETADPLPQHTKQGNPK